MQYSWSSVHCPGAVGKPFPYVEVLIAKPNVYAGNGYDLIAQGDWKKTKVIPGTF